MHLTLTWKATVAAFLVALLAASCGGGGSGSLPPSIDLDSSITSDRCVVTLGYSAAADVKTADVWLEYDGVEGDFGGPARAVRCRSLVGEATSVDMYNDCESSCAPGEKRRLAMNFSVGQGLDDAVLHTPADFFECLFEGNGASLANLTGGLHMSGAQFSEVPAAAGLEVRVECDGWPSSTTTTTSTTTSTLPCDGDDCGTGDVIKVQFHLDDEVLLGSLQIEMSWPSAFGAFDLYPASPSARCTLSPQLNALYATNQSPLEGDPDCTQCLRLGVGFVFVGSGYAGPGALLSCEFRIGEEVPATDDFRIRLIESSDPMLNPVRPFPNVSLSGLPAD